MVRGHARRPDLLTLIGAVTVVLTVLRVLGLW